MMKKMDYRNARRFVLSQMAEIEKQRDIANNPPPKPPLPQMMFDDYASGDGEFIASGITAAILLTMLAWCIVAAFSNHWIEL